MTTKIFVADKVAEFVQKSLNKLGEVLYRPTTKAQELPELIQDYNILVVRSTRVTEDTFKSATDLKMIIRAGAGTDNIDIPKATEHGVFVCNCPGTNSSAVAELVIGHMICADRLIHQTTETLKKGTWCKTKFQGSMGLRGRNLGIVSLGYIGKLVAKAAQGLGMVVYAYDPRKTQEIMDPWKITKMETLTELVEISDVVTVHTVLTEKTKHMFNEEIFKRFKNGAIFINAARGGIVDHTCLPKIVKEKGLKISLDVYEDEPSTTSEEFPQTELAKSITTLTPHIGASTKQASEAVGEMTVEIVQTFLNEKLPPMVNIKNRELLK
ncbi:d-3-phosphoglycerate dehydrogenase [Anaeramoeba flamelloides]|uniref:D-3-phosphoglycerate dehydrogenase n=1 Tax=Anaeramoeba flamelloides TaxID=1746091 RepID=A0AAV7YKF2_9EUKA|nr:d-3-phosphoglycerate dehydrogenase [Anaeramoeba flamelloides]